MTEQTIATWKMVNPVYDTKKVSDFQLVRPLSVAQQVDRFLKAGKTLDYVRNLGIYDFDGEIDESLEDLTRDEDYDIVDAAVAQRDALLRMSQNVDKQIETQQDASIGATEQSTDVKGESSDVPQENQSGK